MQTACCSRWSIAPTCSTARRSTACSSAFVRCSRASSQILRARCRRCRCSRMPSARVCSTNGRATKLPFRTDATMHGLFAEQAAKTPNVVAVMSGGQSMTYAELDARAELGQGACVGWAWVRSASSPCACRDVNMPVALLAVMKAGGAYVALDPAYPADRMGFMLADARAVVVLTTSLLAERLPADTPARVVLVDEGFGPAEPRTEAQTATADNTPTSSTPRAPPASRRASRVAHRSAVAFIAWARHRLRRRRALRGSWPRRRSCFDLSIFEIFVPLALGGGDRGRRERAPGPRGDAAEQHPISLINTVPTARSPS